MLTIAALSLGHQRYFTELVNSDYYLSGGEPEGQWFGKGAEALGRKGTISRRDFNQIFLGKLEGKSLVQNAGRENRQPGWDETFSVPKSVSLKFALFPELRSGIRKCQEDAVKNTLTFEEANFCFSRKGKGGCQHVPSQMVVAMFEHSCSRALDPQLHTHCLIMNVGVQADGSTKAVISKPFYQNKMLLEAISKLNIF